MWKGTTSYSQLVSGRPTPPPPSIAKHHQMCLPLRELPVGFWPKPPSPLGRDNKKQQNYLAPKMPEFFGDLDFTFQAPPPSIQFYSTFHDRLQTRLDTTENSGRFHPSRKYPWNLLPHSTHQTI